jgi:hypothetical protein
VAVAALQWFSRFWKLTTPSLILNDLLGLNVVHTASKWGVIVVSVPKELPRDQRRLVQHGEPQVSFVSRVDLRAASTPAWTRPQLSLTAALGLGQGDDVQTGVC